VPNLDFYAVDEDHTAVLDAVFRLDFRVFEAYSDEGMELREFAGPGEVLMSAQRTASHLMLFAEDSGPAPVIDRIELRPRRGAPASFRFSCRGWGLIQLQLEGLVKDGRLGRCHTNHNTKKRADKWADGYPGLGIPDDWDWAAVTRASGRLNRAIRSMAVDKLGSHPVLPQAADAIGRLRLAYEYGSMLRAEPLPDIAR
jgi:hypothetical protein